MLSVIAPWWHAATAYKDAAAGVATQIAAMPDPTTVVGTLTDQIR